MVFLTEVSLFKKKLCDMPFMSIIHSLYTFHILLCCLLLPGKKGKGGKDDGKKKKDKQKQGGNKVYQLILVILVEVNSPFEIQF